MICLLLPFGDRDHRGLTAAGETGQTGPCTPQGRAKRKTAKPLQAHRMFCQEAGNKAAMVRSTGIGDFSERTQRLQLKITVNAEIGRVALIINSAESGRNLNIKKLISRNVRIQQILPRFFTKNILIGKGRILLNEITNLILCHFFAIPQRLDS